MDRHLFITPAEFFSVVKNNQYFILFLFNMGQVTKTFINNTFNFSLTFLCMQQIGKLVTIKMCNYFFN